MNSTSERRHNIDWVRVLAFLLLIFFHCAMPFVNYGWEIKNMETSAGLTRLIWWILQWRLPLLFAMFFTIPLQVYFEWLQEGKISMSYVEFYPSVF